MIKIPTHIILISIAALSIISMTSCGVKNDSLLSQISDKKIITIYTVCPHKNGQRIQDHYLFKIKDDRITLTERHGDRITNRLSRNLALAEELDNFIQESSDEKVKNDVCEYYVKCGIQESSIYPDSKSLDKLDALLLSFSNTE